MDWPTFLCHDGGMSTPPAEERVQAAYEAIARADAEAERIKRQARVNFGAVVNELVDSREMQQEKVAKQVGKTREWVRRQQVDARD